MGFAEPMWQLPHREGRLRYPFCFGIFAYIGHRSPRRPVLALTDQAAASGAAEPHAGGQRPGRRSLVDLEDLPASGVPLALWVAFKNDGQIESPRKLFLDA